MTQRARPATLPSLVQLLGMLLVGGLAAGCVMTPVAFDPGAYESVLIYGADRHFKLDWEPGERGGRPTVTGHIENLWGFLVYDMRLRVESLDADGKVLRNNVGYVFGYIGGGARVYFEVPVPERAPSYRVSVLTFGFTTGDGARQDP